MHGNGIPLVTQEEAEEDYERKDYAEAFRLYKSVAGDGDAYAQYVVAFMYRRGQGVGAARKEESENVWS